MGVRMKRHTQRGGNCGFLSLSLSLFFLLSAGLRGHVVTLRPSARPTTPCGYGVAGFGVPLTAAQNYVVGSMFLGCKPRPLRYEPLAGEGNS